MFDRIKLLCDEKHISVSALEEELGFATGTIGKWRNSCPKAENLYLVASKLGVSMEYLLCATEKPAHKNEDGLTDTQREIIRIVKGLNDDLASALLTMLKASEAVRNRRDDS